jgi:predicted amidophosphoribosyltransferase
MTSDVVIGKDGRRIPLKDAKGVCQRCGDPFEYKQRTRPIKECERCRAEISRELFVARYARQRARRKEAAGKEKCPRRKLIPYAGYDKNEHH